MRVTTKLKVKGTHYYRAGEALENGTLTTGSLIHLVHEAHNPDDENAVGVRLGDAETMLGHIPKELALKYASLVDEGRIIEARVSSVSRNGNYIDLVIRITYDKREEKIARGHNSNSSRSVPSLLPPGPGVYAIRNMETGRLYVGSSNDVRNRVLSHFRELNNSAHSNRLLQEDFNRLGFDKFDAYLILRTTRDIQTAEKNKILKLLAKGQSLYNMTEDGRGIPPGGHDLNRLPRSISDRQGRQRKRRKPFIWFCDHCFIFVKGRIEKVNGERKWVMHCPRCKRRY